MTPLYSARTTYRILILLFLAFFLFPDQGFAQIVVVNPTDSVIVAPTFPNECQTFLAAYSTENVSCPDAQDGRAILQLSPVGTNALPALEELSFNWNLSSLENIPSPKELSVGAYSVTITYSEQSCSLIVDNIFIKAPAPLAINCFVVNNVSVPGTQDGLAKVDCSNGGPPYNIYWTGPVSGDLVANSPGLNSLNNLQAGGYNVTVTDNCGPIQTCSFTIREPSCDNLVDVATTNPTCNGLANGMITITSNPIYNERTFEYRWLHDGLSTTQPSRSLPAGQYTVIISDNTGCRDTIIKTLTAPLAMTIQIDGIILDTFNKYGEQGQIKGHIVNGSPPFDILWTGSPSGSTYGVNNPNFTILNLKKGSYSINVEDSNGCQTQSDVFIGEIFFVEDRVEFIIDYSKVLDKSTIPPFMDTLRAKGAKLIDTCHCIGGMWLLQHWRNGPDDIIIIDNTPPQGAQSTTKSDDNGWFGGITTPVQEDRPIKNSYENCKYRPGQGTGPNFKVKVAIIDSGVNLRYKGSSKSGHPALTGLDWTNEDPTDLFNCIIGDLNGYDFINKTASVVDNVGHGTHIAGAIAHKFPEDIGMELMNLKVYDKEKQGNVFGLTCAIHYAVSHQAQVINLSLGYYNKHPFEPLYNALHRADSANILVVLSAGNDTIDIDSRLTNTLPLRWPASFKAQSIKTKDGKPLPPLKNLLAVASAPEPGENFLVAGYSNWGKTLVDITTNGINTSPHLDSTYLTLKGTSMATANVSREAALIKAYNKGLEPDEIIDAMVNSASEFRGDNTRQIQSQGIFDVTQLHGNILPVNVGSNLTERALVHAPGGTATVSPNFGTTNIVKEKLYILLGDGNTFYDDVEIIVADNFNGLKTTTPRYRATFCSTNSITWFGQDDNGNQLPEKFYHIRIFINGGSIMNQPYKVLIENP